MYPQTSFTENPLSPDNRKDSSEFGLKVMRQCYARWKSGYGGETWVAKVLRYEKSRLYAMGCQPEEQYKDLIKIEGTPVVLNIDYSALGIAPPLLNAKIDRYLERIEKIKTRASGQLASDKKKKEKDEARFKMNYRPALQQAQEESGLHLEDFSDHDPKSERELDVRFKTKILKEESIMQRAINNVFEQNEWDDVIKKRLIWDTMCCGWACCLTELNGNGWIKTPAVRPEDFITSYSELDNFEDWQWQGQKRSISIAEVRLRTSGMTKPDGSPIITEEELWELSVKMKGTCGNSSDWLCDWNYDYNTAVARPYDAINVQIVDLYYKTLYNLTYRKEKVGFDRDKLYDDKLEKLPPQRKETSKPYYVAYHGVWIIDTDYLLEWGLAKDMLKPNNNLVEIRSPYTIYMNNNNKCNNKSLVESMIPMIDMLQNIHCKSQAIIAMIAPDGYTIDTLGISNIDMGQGLGVLSPMQLLGIYLQTGNQYFEGRDIEGDDRRQEPPIKPNTHPASNKLKELDEQFWNTYKKLQIITGDNNLASGNITNQATANSTLNDAREIAAEPSNYVYKTSLNIKKGTAKNVELLLLDKFFLKENSFDGYNMALGEDDIKYMRDLGSDIAQLVFDTKIEVVLDSGDQQKWDRRIEIALEQGQIGLEAVAELDLIDDATLRSFMLAQYAKQKKADDQATSAQNQQANLVQAKAAAQSKADGDMAVGKQDHNNKLDQMQQQQANEVVKAAHTWSGVLKEKVADSILSQEGATVGQVPAFIWEGLGITEESQKQMLLLSMQQQAQRQQEAQQKKQVEQIAQQQAQQAQQAQQQGPPNPGQQAA
jgi:hypothetical protein